MAETLFPVFNVPVITSADKDVEKRYKESVAFDFETGDFKLNGAHRMMKASGRETYMNWCRKIVVTERLSCLSYSSDIGTETDYAFSQADQKAVESAMERTINEALMINPKTEYVRNFSFQWEGERLNCTFTVKGRDWEEFEMKIKY